eukprot:7696389-Alexandrium_andersonii.AAC.1
MARDAGVALPVDPSPTSAPESPRSVGPPLQGARRWSRPPLSNSPTATPTARRVVPRARGRDCRPLLLGGRCCGGRGSG